jgi:hypothetical protein
MCPVTAEQGRTDEEHDEGPADPRAHPWLGESCPHCGTPIDISPAFEMDPEGKGQRVHRARFCRQVLLQQKALDRARLGAATTFQFWGAGGRRGDYVLVCYDDEEDDWELQVFTCEDPSMFGDHSVRFRTQDEATAEAIRLAATLTTAPREPKVIPGSGGLITRQDHDEGPRRRT